MRTITSEDLFQYMTLGHLKIYDAIVVEGYDGVGKGTILNQLSRYLGVTPYRPDYKFWIGYDLKSVDRWKISGFFWDIYSHFNFHNSTPMLFDRGVLSGAVYNHDISIAQGYKSMLRDMRVLHILVTCDQEDYIRFQKLRKPDIADSLADMMWSKCKKFTDLYIECIEDAGVESILCYNKYDEELAVRSRDTCEGCGHYSYGYCRHPEIDAPVSPHDLRCSKSLDKEVQDIVR